MFVGKPKHIYHPETGETTIVPEYYKEDEYLVMAALAGSTDNIESQSNPEPVAFSDVEYDPKIDPMNMEQYKPKVYRVMPVFQKDIVDDSIQKAEDVEKAEVCECEDIGEKKISSGNNSDLPPRYEDIFTEVESSGDDYSYSNGLSSPYKELDGGDNEKRARERHSRAVRVHKILAICLLVFLLTLLAGQKIGCPNKEAATTAKEARPTKMCDMA